MHVMLSDPRQPTADLIKHRPSQSPASTPLSDWLMWSAGKSYAGNASIPIKM